jgi:D-3-phosphoglycerate dehydrogenase
VEPLPWPDRLEEADFIILACALTAENRHLLRREVLGRCRDGVRVVNVSRGGLINEGDLAAALATGKVHSAALEVMETEPLPPDSPLRNYPRCLFGSHNASNTVEAVRRTSETAVRLLAQALDGSP